MTQINATAVFELNEQNLRLLKDMQVHFIEEIPEGATHLAFLEDGDACFLSTTEQEMFDQLGLLGLGTMRFVRYVKNLKVEI